MRFLRSAAAIAALAAVAACRDDVVTPRAAGEADPSPGMGIFDPKKGPVRTGYVLGNDGETPVRVSYQVVGGVAVWDGDAPLGPAEAIAATPAEALRRRGGGGGLVSLAPRGGSFSLHATGAAAWSGGTVPYVVEGTPPANLSPAMSQITSQVPGIRFVSRTTQTNYLRIYDHGRVGYHQYYGGSPVRSLGLDYGLGNSKAILMHELGHVMGFQHEHQRCDRGSYIRILDTNPYPGEFATNCGAVKVGGYDKSSVMH